MTWSRWPRCAALLCAVLLQAACASRDFSLHSLPAETPASDNAVAIQRAQLAQAQLQAAAAAVASTPGAALTPVDVPSLQTYDPWEHVNRLTYGFNARFDEHVFLPVANGYRRLPQPLLGHVLQKQNRLQTPGECIGWRVTTADFET